MDVVEVNDDAAQQATDAVAAVAAVAVTPAAEAAPAAAAAAPATGGPTCTNNDKGIPTVQKAACDARRLPFADGARLIESVVLGEPELKKPSFAPSYFAYKLSVQSMPELNVPDVERRFSEFVWLRDMLQSFFPGVFIPPLPPKKAVGNKEAGFVAERREDLQRFLDRVIARPFLADSVPFQMFVARPKFDLGKKDVEKDLKSHQYSAGVKIYADLFREFMEQELPDSSEEKMSEMNAFFAAQEQKLNTLYSTTHSIGIGWLNMIKDTSTMSQGLIEIREIENDFVLRPDPPRPDISSLFSQWSDSVKQIAPVYYTHLYTTYKYELQDVQAFIDMLRQREQLHAETAKAIAAASAWRDATSAPKETPKSIAQKAHDMANEEQCIAMLDCVTKLILFYELPRFWGRKIVSFHGNMSHFAKAQAQNVGKLSKIWDSAQQIVPTE